MATLTYESQKFETSEDELMSLFLIAQDQFEKGKTFFVQVGSNDSMKLLAFAPGNDISFEFESATVIQTPEDHALALVPLLSRGLVEIWTGAEPQ